LRRAATGFDALCFLRPSAAVGLLSSRRGQALFVMAGSAFTMSSEPRVVSCLGGLSGLPVPANNQCDMHGAAAVGTGGFGLHQSEQLFGVLATPDPATIGHPTVRVPDDPGSNRTKPKSAAPRA